MTKIYLRELTPIEKQRYNNEISLEICYNIDIKKDKAYFKKYHNRSARYFKLTEVKA